MAKSKLRSLGYYGGKRGYGKAEWIAEHLPQERNSVYVEPFAGMAGVLLARRPVGQEILNDINGRIVNWWRMVRDQPDELSRLQHNTPRSRAEYDWAVANIDNDDLPPVRRALAFMIAVEQSMFHGDGNAGDFHRLQTGQAIGRVRGCEILELADRMRLVQLECMDAVKLIKQVAGCPGLVLYCDPPYPTSDTSPYAVADVDRDQLADALLSVHGAAAISGYGDEWDLLGWRREERAALRNNLNGQKPLRTEVLWINDAAAQTKPRLF